MNDNLGRALEEVGDLYTGRAADPARSLVPAITLPEESGAADRSPTVSRELVAGEGTSELRPEPEETATPTSRPRSTDSGTYEVRSGDTLSQIAERVYGSSRAWADILAANPKLSDAAKIRPGMKLVLPEQARLSGANPVASRRSENRATSAEPVDLRHVPMTADSIARLQEHRRSSARSAAATPPRSTAPSSPVRRLGDVESHKVQKGDTLMGIALKHYGSKSAWRKIYDANSATMKNKNQLRVGMVLRLPS